VRERPLAPRHAVPLPGVRAPPPQPSPGPPPDETATNTRFFGVYRLDPERYARDLTRVSQEVLQQLAAVDGAKLEVTVEIQASAADGFPMDRVRVVLENARTLKFHQAGFDDE